MPQEHTATAAERNEEQTANAVTKPNVWMESMLRPLPSILTCQQHTTALNIYLSVHHHQCQFLPHSNA